MKRAKWSHCLPVAMRKYAKWNDDGDAVIRRNRQRYWRFHNWIVP